MSTFQKTVKFIASILALQLLAEPFSVAANGPSAQIRTASAAAGAKTEVSSRTAEEPAAGEAGLWFDMNGDGVTGQEDYDLTADWLRNYSTSLTGQGKTIVLNGNNEAADSLACLIRQEVGIRQKISYGVNTDGAARYCINNVGLGTPVGNQNPYGTCWAFAENSAVESAILRARTGYSGTGIRPEATKEPQLEEAGVAPLLSARYLTEQTYELQKTGSQKGEGLTTGGAKLLERYNVGGFLTMAETVYGNWTGPVSEAALPYADLSAALLNGTKISAVSGKQAALQGHLQDYYYYESPAVTREDPSSQLRVWEDYDPEASAAWKQALVRFGALAAMISSDRETPGASGRTTDFNYNTWMQYNADQNVVHDHSVTIVGWDDTIPASMFSDDPKEQPPGDGAWLVKNSWGSYADSEQRYGSGWLEKTLSRAEAGTKAWYLNQISYNYGIPDEDGHGTGYFWLSYYDHSMAGAAAAAEVDIPEDGYEYDNNYTYQYAVSLTNDPLVLPAANDKTRVCNAFVSGGNEVLEAVSAEPPVPGCRVQIEVYVLPEETGTSGGAATKKTKAWDPSVLDRIRPVSQKTISLSEAGLHTVKLDAPVSLKKGDRFAVVETLTSVSETTGKTVSWLNLETAVAPELQTKENYGGNRTVVVSNPGETYACVQQKDGSCAWMTPAQLNRTESGSVFCYGNARIHAYTANK